MMLIAEYIGRARPDIDAPGFCRELTEYVRDRYAGTDIRRLTRHPEERLTASCIVYSHHHRQIWMVGDCQCLVDGHLYENPKPYEHILAEKRSAIIHEMLHCGKATVDSLRADDTARKAIIPDMLKTMRYQNNTSLPTTETAGDTDDTDKRRSHGTTDEAYAVVDGFPIPINKVRIIRLDSRPHSVVLASDGYPFLHPTLAESEAALHKQLTTDPLNINTFKATKAFAEGNNSFDDRAFISFRI